MDGFSIIMTAEHTQGDDLSKKQQHYFKGILSYKIHFMMVFIQNYSSGSAAHSTQKVWHQLVPLKTFFLQWD